jgi:filamentous hemagglutinin
MMWSTNRDLDAGKGKQTSIVTSPPLILYDAYGNVTKTPSTPQTGAGITTLIGVPGVPPGNVDLFAPRGTIDAGQAGIRVSGNITLAPLQILNASNIRPETFVRWHWAGYRCYWGSRACDAPDWHFAGIPAA